MSLTPLFRQATALHQSGKLSQAEKIYHDILHQSPGHPEALRLLGVIRLQHDEPSSAVTYLMQSLDSHPNKINVWMNLASAERQLGQLESAKKWLQAILEVDDSHIAAHYNLGNVYRAMAQLEGARVEYQRVLELDPEHDGCSYNLALVLKNMGEIDAAVALYRDLIRRNPDHAQAWYGLSDLKTYRFSEAELEAVTTSASRQNIAIADNIMLNFAAAKAHEDHQAYSVSFECLMRANRLRRLQIQPQSVDRIGLSERIRNVFTMELVKSAGTDMPTDDSPIFIVSMPRSGSTLIEQILASHSLVNGAAELPDMGQLVREWNEVLPGYRYPESIKLMKPPDLARLGWKYLESTVRWREQSPFFTDKMPNNFAWLGVIAMALPGATLVEAARHPLDICLSCFKQNFASGHTYSFSLDELADYYIYYHRVMQHWHELFPGRILRVQYEQVLANPERVIRQLLDHCSLEFEDACINFHKTRREIRTASAAQVTQELYQHSNQRWRHYEPQLKPIIEKLIDAGVLDENCGI